MKILFAGLWHLSSGTAACLADLGFDVTGWDPDLEVVKKLSTGKAPVFEPGLDELLARGIQAGKLHFTNSAKQAASAKEFMWVTFDTPVDADDRADDAWVKRQVKILV